MHQRILSWLILCAFSAAISLRAQAPATATAMPPGRVLVAKVIGSVTMTVNGATTALKMDDSIPQTATVNTAAASSAVLVFSNGATTQLGEGTELVIQEFLQDPFAATIRVADLEDEPTPSRTRLRLNKGELVGNVKKLKHDQGSTFTVETPVGAAGIRGTTFRIVFRPNGTGLAFFSLSTVEGNVAFGGTTGGGAADPNAGGAGAAGGGAGGAAGGTPGGGGPGGGVSVGGGQEVVITVSVDINPTTGAVTITTPTTVTSSLVVPISAATQTDVVQQAQTMAVAVLTTSFTSSATSGITGTTGTTGSTGNTGNQGTNPAPGNNTQQATQPAQRITTGDGQPGG